MLTGRAIILTLSEIEQLRIDHSGLDFGLGITVWTLLATKKERMAR
jgi:hypothetical protein